MSSARNTRAFSTLRLAGLITLAGLLVAVFLGVGSYFFWQAEKKNDVQSQRALQDLRSRLETLKREREDLRGSEDTYKALRNQGLFIPEKRLDFIEAMNALKAKYRLIAFDYDVQPQRPLKFASGGTFAAADVRASRIKLRVTALHDADLLAFLEEFARIQRGYFPMDKCAIRRKSEAAPMAATAASVNEVNRGDDRANATSTEKADGALNKPIPIDAECTLEWITLTDKATGAVTPTPESTPRRPI